MAHEPTIAFIGNLGGDPDFRKTPQNIPVASFSVAVTPSNYADGTWTDGDTMWFRVTCWKEDAVAAAKKLQKGDKVRVQGRFVVNPYTTKAGEERTSLDVTADSRGVTKVLTAKDDGSSEEDDPWHT